ERFPAFLTVTAYLKYLRDGMTLAAA
ncbi:MAG: hypothetical protein JWM61_2772, partial [Micrococcaceae bacterium]|nr:hypothetical protein [Micrococcaceae bacterium]